MMDMTLEENSAHYVIRAYDDHSVTINDTIYHQSILVLSTGINTWRPNQLSEIKNTDWAEILALSPGLLLLGTGDVHLFPEPAWLEPLYAARIAVEIMSTPAACRTYNLLASDKRSVAAALIISPPHV